MKIGGIILLVLGIFSTIGGLLRASQGFEASIGGGLAFGVLGIFLISRANKKKEEEDKKKEWEKGSKEE
ncbi:MAG: hypothetical protein RID18_16285 [Cytophagales bacterium]